MREHTDGDFPFANDFNAVVRDALASGTLVSSGCTVGDGGSNDMSAHVASGDVFVNGSSISVSSQSVTLADADPDHDRYDLVVVDDTESASAVTGTASSTPQAPSIPGDAVLLAFVEVPAGAGGVTDAEIEDARVVVDGVPNAVISQGSGSGLDADTLDGSETPLPASDIEDGEGSGLDADTLDGNDTPLDPSTIDDGDGSGLDADTVDGNHASELDTPEVFLGSVETMENSGSTGLSAYGGTGSVKLWFHRWVDAVDIWVSHDSFGEVQSLEYKHDNTGNWVSFWNDPSNHANSWVTYSFDNVVFLEGLKAIWQNDNNQNSSAELRAIPHISETHPTG